MARKPSTRSAETVFVPATALALVREAGRLKATTSAPLACSNLRLSIMVFTAFSGARCAQYRAHDAQVCAAAAKIIRQLGFDISFAGLGIAQQESGGLHDHAVDAIAALHGLLFDKGFLERMRLCIRAKALKRDDLAFDRRHWGNARANRRSINVHGAGAALAETTPETWTVQAEFIAQDIEQRRVGVIYGY